MAIRGTGDKWVIRLIPKEHDVTTGGRDVRLSRGIGTFDAALEDSIQRY